MGEAKLKHNALSAALNLRMIMEGGQDIEAPITCWLAAIIDMMDGRQVIELCNRVEQRKLDVSASLVSGLTGNKLC